MKNVIIGQQSSIYSLGKSIGGSMLGIWAYYLLSPFNILFVFFKETHFAEVLVLVTGLKLIICAVTCYEFLKSKSENNKISMLLGITYSLCGFVAAFQMNIMWLDGMIFLPLICMGIDKVIKKQKANMYIITLSLAIITNFYIGFSICIFVAIYYMYSYIINYEHRSIKIIIKDFFKFALYSIIGLAISSVIIIPVYFMLSDGKGSEVSVFLSDIKESNFKYIELLGKLLPGAINNHEVFYGLPNIYSGLITIFFVEIFFINKNIKIKEKISAIVLILLMIFMMHNKLINLLWHGFKNPTGFPYRYSFIFSFIMIMIAGSGMKKIKEIPLKQVIGISVFNLLVCVGIYMEKYDYIENFSIYISAILLIIYSICFIMYIKKEKKIFVGLIIIFGLAELLYNYSYAYKNIEHLERTPYVQSVKKYLEMFDEVRAYDNSLYRIEKKSNFYLNDSLLFNYNGIGHSSSTYDSNVTNLLKKIGYNYYMDWPSYGSGNTFLTDMLFGIKYKISSSGVEENFKEVKDIGENKLLENENKLSIGYMTKGYIKNIENGKENNPFELQESFLNQLNETKLTYFNDIDLQNIKLEKVQKEDAEYKGLDENSYIELNYDLKNIENNNIYFYIKSNYNSDNSAFKLYINDEFYDLYLGSNKMGVLNINRNKANIKEKLNIKLYFNTENKVNIDEFYLKALNDNEINESYETLQKSQLEGLKYKHNKLSGNINCEEEGYLSTTIPYETGWKIYVDGNYTQAENDAEFIAIKMSPGNHKIEFKYQCKGLKQGMIISIVGIIALIIINKFYYKKIG